MRITRVFCFTLIFALLQIFNLTILMDLNYLNLRIIYGFLFLITIPGILLYNSLKIKTSDFWESIVYVVGLSVFFLMVLGFLTNLIFHKFGIPEPLSPLPLMLTMNALLLPLFLHALVVQPVNTKYKVALPNLRYRDLFIFFLTLFFPILSVSGAVALNNNVFNPYTPVMLGVMGVSVLGLFAERFKINRNVLVISVFLISLSLLFMTSLRGWYTTGHDNQLEYYVSQLSSKDKFWDIGEYRDPYNASLSITILPAVFEALTGITSEYVFKILFQVIFAFLSVALYLLFEKYTTKFISFLSVIVFLSFPTFINDMPMLNRQEIAMFYFSLLLLLIFSRSVKRIKNLKIFYIFGLAMIVSHYSTAYIAIALLSIAYAANFVISRMSFNFVKHLKLPRKMQKLGVLMILSLIVFTFIWNVQLTQTTSGISRIVKSTYENIGKTFSQDLKAGAVSYSLFSFESLSIEDLFKDYQKSEIEVAMSRESSDRLFSENITKDYDMKLVKDTQRPVTDFGNYIKINFGIDPYELNYFMRQMSARLVQLFLLIGLVVLVFRKSKLVSKMDPEYIILSVASVLVIALFIFLPVLSLEYGTQRLFQQSLVISALPLVIGFIALFGVRITTIIISVLFLSLTGFIPYVTGGYNPQLHLENAGSYYDSYLTHTSEYVSMTWLKNNYSSRYDVYSTDPTRAKMVAITGIFSKRGMLPQVITTNDYVYLDYTTTTKSEVATSHKGDILIYKYPITFLDNNKDLIYTNSQTKIFK